MSPSWDGTESVLEIVEQSIIPMRSPEFRECPIALHKDVQRVLRASYPDGIYKHQAKALEAICKGVDVCLATSTASGKSLVFMAAAANRLLRSKTDTVLVLYPAKALIQDQMSKWKATLAHFGLAPGFIDGSVRVEGRERILRQHRVILMTPDVAHAWLLSHLSSLDVRAFLRSLRILVLDEAHVYDGVFGTNMAYFIRRLLAVSKVETIVTATATIGEPATFVGGLTGRQPYVLGPEEDGSGAPEKTIILARRTRGKDIEAYAGLIESVAHSGQGRFLAFADSRKLVEQLVAVVHRSSSTDDADAGPPDVPDSAEVPEGCARVLPYRAGYEEDDRLKIQKALEEGELAGVVSTSALELGLDIGDIDLVLLLGTPPSVKAFRQRLGRAGRRHSGSCVLVDNKGSVVALRGGLNEYLQRLPEPAWLYLENRFVQYSQALCAAVEATEFGVSAYGRSAFDSLPASFGHMLENELNPASGVPDDLYLLKQRAQAGPHFEFPVRSGIEKSFEVKMHVGSFPRPLGSLSYAQALREAYPGAVYYYMARPYRVSHFNYRSAEIRVRREKRFTTQPVTQTMVFPRLPGGVLRYQTSDEGFLVETNLQVSERVVGFTEMRGPNKTTHEYGPLSPYAQRPVTRFFETTGVCWHFAAHDVHSGSLAYLVLSAFSSLCGVQQRDLGVGTFRAHASSVWSQECQGICIYDAVHGSLRLTRQLAERFREVLDFATGLPSLQGDDGTNLRASLDLFRSLITRTAQQAVPEAGESHCQAEGDWLTVIAPTQKAILQHGNGTEEVEVIAFRYTPQGPMYQLKPPGPGSTWMVRASCVVPMLGETRQEEVNLMTGETRPVK